MLLVLFARSEIPLVATIDHIMLTEIKEGILKKMPIGGNSLKNHNPVIEIFPINQLSKMSIIDGPIVYDAHAQLSLF